MKKKHLILAVLAIVLVLCASIGTTLSYFTTYSDAKGGYVIHLSPRTEITEDVDGNIKKIQILNNGLSDEDTGSFPIFVRVKVFNGTDCTTESVNSAGWEYSAEDGYYYYQNVIYAGERTAFLNIEVKATESAAAGDVIDVIVVYEYVPAVFDSNGNPDSNTAWAMGNIKLIAG